MRSSVLSKDFGYFLLLVFSFGFSFHRPKLPFWSDEVGLFVWNTLRYLSSVSTTLDKGYLSIVLSTKKFFCGIFSSFISSLYTSHYHYSRYLFLLSYRLRTLLPSFQIKIYTTVPPVCLFGKLIYGFLDLTRDGDESFHRDLLPVGGCCGTSPLIHSTSVFLPIPPVG